MVTGHGGRSLGSTPVAAGSEARRRKVTQSDNPDGIATFKIGVRHALCLSSRFEYQIRDRVGV
jgi:hypothetical protein